MNDFKKAIELVLEEHSEAVKKQSGKPMDIIF